jgi:hypothetical protein
MSKFSAADTLELPWSSASSWSKTSGTPIAAEQRVSEEEARKRGLEAKSKEFRGKGRGGLREGVMRKESYGVNQLTIR